MVEVKCKNAANGKIINLLKYIDSSSLKWRENNSLSLQSVQQMMCCESPPLVRFAGHFEIKSLYCSGPDG